MPPTRSAVAIDPALLAAIKQAVRDEITTELTEIRKALKSLVEINQRLEDVERGLQFTSERLNSAIKDILPSISSHMTQLSEKLSLQTLEIDVHRRKWNLVLHGLNGPAGEDETRTRAACIKFAREVLKVPDADATQMAACHRLAKTQNAGIIIRFCDLAQRDRWLAGTRNLRDYQGPRISLSPDLPPVLRPLKDSLMQKRKNLAPDQKSVSRVRYRPQWPFVELQIGNRPPIKPDTSVTDVVTKALGMNPIFRIVETIEPIPEDQSSDESTVTED